MRPPPSLPLYFPYYDTFNDVDEAKRKKIHYTFLYRHFLEWEFCHAELARGRGARVVDLAICIRSILEGFSGDV